MLLPVESVLNGTWGGGAALPPQWSDFLLMYRMRWSWQQLQGTPAMVRRYCLEFLGLISKAEEAEREKAKRKSRTKGPH